MLVGGKTTWTSRRPDRAVVAVEESTKAQSGPPFSGLRNHHRSTEFCESHCYQAQSAIYQPIEMVEVRADGRHLALARR